jgi:hypothetical protein
MTWKGKHPVVQLVTNIYRTGVKLTKEAMGAVETQLQRLPSLEKWFALYYYEKSEDLVELRKVIEEIMKDTFTGTRQKKDQVPFREWNKQKWTEPEIPAIRMEEAYALLHNTLLLGEQALHSLAFADRAQANKFTTSSPAMPLSEARDIVHTILMKWVTVTVI